MLKLSESFERGDYTYISSITNILDKEKEINTLSKISTMSEIQEALQRLHEAGYEIKDSSFFEEVSIDKEKGYNLKDLILVAISKGAKIEAPKSTIPEIHMRPDVCIISAYDKLCTLITADQESAQKLLVHCNNYLSPEFANPLRQHIAEIIFDDFQNAIAERFACNKPFSLRKMKAEIILIKNLNKIENSTREDYERSLKSGFIKCETTFEDYASLKKVLPIMQQNLLIQKLTFTTHLYETIARILIDFSSSILPLPELICENIANFLQLEDMLTLAEVNTSAYKAFEPTSIFEIDHQ